MRWKVVIERWKRRLELGSEDSQCLWLVLGIVFHEITV